MKIIKAKKGWMVYDLEDSEITMYTVSDEGRVSKSGTIIINKDVKDKIKDFDVQPSGELLAIISGNTIYSFSQKDNKATPILTPDSKPEVVFIHPTERLIYYTNCAQPIGATLKIFDMSSKSEKQHRIHSCRFDIDFKENMFWDLDANRIFRQSLEEGETSKIMAAIRRDVFKTSALSSDHMFFMLSEKKDIYKMKTSLKLQKQMSLSDYAIEPMLTRIYGLNPAIFNVENSMIEVLDLNFENIINEIEIKLDAKPIRTLRYMDDVKSTIFFWIHDSNKGKVEYVKVVNDAKVVVEKRGSFQVPTDGADIIDFEFNNINNVFFYATEGKIFRNYINILKPFDDKFETIRLPFEGTIKGVGMQHDDSNLIVSYCDKFTSAMAVIHTFLEFRLKQTLTQVPTCSRRIFIDEQVKKDNRILASSTRGLYNLGFNGEVERLSSLEDIGNFLLDGNHVYFASKTDGPGIYKLEKRRIAKIDHKLPLVVNGNFEIIKVRDDQKDMNTNPDDLSKDKKDINPDLGDQSQGKKVNPDLGDQSQGKKVNPDLDDQSQGKKVNPDLGDQSQGKKVLNKVSNDQSVNKEGPVIEEKIAKSEEKVNSKGSKSSALSTRPQLILLLLIQIVLLIENRR